MIFMRRILTLGATMLAAAAMASPALAHISNGAGEAGESGHDHPVTYCRDSSRYPGEGDVMTTDQQPVGDWHECAEGEAAGYRQAREQRQQQEADARAAQDKTWQAQIDREQGEADQLKEQVRLCQQQPSNAACRPVSSSVPRTKPAPPKPVSFVASQQARVSRHANPAGVGARPIPEARDDTGLEDAVDVPDLRQFALQSDPTDGRSPRNLVWFSFVAMAAIASLGYGLWRVLFVEV